MPSFFRDVAAVGSLCLGVATADEALAQPVVVQNSDPIVPVASPPVDPLAAFRASEPTSEPRRTVGQVLTIVGMAHLTVGVVSFAAMMADADRRDFQTDQTGGFEHCSSCRVMAYIVGLPNMITGGGLILAGVPLWITGALPKRAPTAPSRTADGETVEPYVPRVSVRGAGLAMTIPF